MSIFCILGDCGKNKCHNCFPVVNCSMNHEYCRKNGICKEINTKNQQILIDREIIVEHKYKILVTGCAGFIGSHVCEKLLSMDQIVLGVDIMNDYYDVKLKEKNLEILRQHKNF